MGVKAVQDLVKTRGSDWWNVEALIVVRQNGDQGVLLQTAAITQKKLGLKNDGSCFDVGLGCSGYVYGLSILKSHMIEMGYKHGILITVDPYSKIIDKTDKNTSLLFGDAATATLLSPRGKFKVNRPKLNTQGEELMSLYKGEYLKMNGRAVFNFAATFVPKQIENYLETNKVKKEDVDLYLLHQGSAFIVETIARKLGVDREKCPKDIRYTGNTVSSSIPLLLSKYIGRANLNKILLSGFGVGLSWATTVLESK